jgi:Domain of unknown function (DUF4333)
MVHLARFAVPVAGLSLAFATAGCGKTVIDSQKAEDFIQSSLEKRGATITSVSCPDDVEVAPKKSFDCTAASDQGKTATITMTILNDNADVKVTDFSVSK